MNFRNALVRATRTTIQTAAGAVLAFFLAVKGDGTFLSIKAHGEVLAFGLFLALVTGVVSLLQNLAEDASDMNVPK